MRNPGIFAVKNAYRRLGYRLYKAYFHHFEHKLYDFQTIDIVRTLSADAVCVDVGVNDAQIFDFIYRHCSKGKIYGFEPVKGLYERLARRYDKKRAIILKPYRF